jgi:hypothetical protein
VCVRVWVWVSCVCPPEHRLSRDFDYHRIPAPWIQLKLLRILAILGANDQRASEVCVCCWPMH